MAMRYNFVAATVLLVSEAPERRCEWVGGRAAGRRARAGPILVAVARRCSAAQPQAVGGLTRCSMAPNTDAPSRPFISMRTVSPKRM